MGIINRFYRTLKEKTLKYFRESGSTSWIVVIDKIIKNYNNPESRTRKCTPTEASNHFTVYDYFKCKRKTEVIKSIYMNKNVE